MIHNPVDVAYYTQTNQLALSLWRRDLEELALRRYDEASGHALDGNPKRAAWCEYWAKRVAA